MTFYHCSDCKEYFDEDELESKNICLEDYYGVGSDFQSRHYSTIGVCPHCGSEDVGEVSEYDLIEEINDLRYKNAQLRKQIKELKNGK